MVDNFHIHLIKIRWKGPNYQTVVVSEQTVATKRRIAEAMAIDSRLEPLNIFHISPQCRPGVNFESRRICVCIYIYVYIHTCMHTHTYIYMYVCVYIYTYSFCISSFEELCAQRQIVHSEQSKSNVQTILSAANVLTCGIVPKLYNGFTPLLPK